MSNILKNWWKFLGLVLIMYVFTMIFIVPMGPGLLSSEAKVNETGVASIEVSSFATHFDQNPENIKAFLRLEDSGITIECDNIIAQTNSKLSLQANLPDTVTSSSWDLLINAEKDGTLYLPNALFHEPKIKAAPTDLSFTIRDLSNVQVFEKDLGLHFPYQPRIVESIRNLHLHVPMWFTMFFLMGIGFAQSIRTLRNSNNELSDTKAFSSIKVGIFFGVLGLLTGSLWARFTWGAWWVNDPQLNGALVSVMIYSGYLILRSSILENSQRARLSAVYNLFAFVILMVLLMVLPRYTESLHPGKSGNPAFSKYDLDSSLRMVFYPAVIGWILIGTWMYNLTLRAELLKNKIQSKKEY